MESQSTPKKRFFQYLTAITLNKHAKYMDDKNRVFTGKVKDNKKMSVLEKYATEGYLEVEGWGVDKDLIELIRILDQFQEAEKISGPLWEIGVHHGRTLILFGLIARKNESIIGIDLFEHAQHQNLDLSGCGSYQALMENISKFSPDVTYDIYEANSFLLEDEVLERMQNARLGHIDGGHFFEVVLNDMMIAQSTIGLGGIIIVDDYLHSGFPEVQEAVHRYFWTSSRIKAIPFAIGKNKLFLIGISFHQKILNHLQQALPEGKNKPVKVFGYDAFCVDPH